MHESLYNSTSAAITSATSSAAARSLGLRQGPGVRVPAQVHHLVGLGRELSGASADCTSSMSAEFQRAGEDSRNHMV